VPDVRHHFERLLASACRAPNTLPKANQRIHDERRPRQTHQRQPCVVIKQHDGVADKRERLAQHVARRLGDGPLHLPDIRLVEIEGADLQPCGGTHLARSGEIGAVHVAKIENKGRNNKRVVLALA